MKCLGCDKVLVSHHKSVSWQPVRVAIGAAKELRAGVCMACLELVGLCVPTDTDTDDYPEPPTPDQVEAFLRDVIASRVGRGPC